MSEKFGLLALCGALAFAVQASPVAVGPVRVENVRLRGKVPDELVHAVEFKDVNGDGDSSGVGRVERLKM